MASGRMLVGSIQPCIKVYVMMTESSASRLQRDLRRIRLSKPVRELQRSGKCDQKPLAP